MLDFLNSVKVHFKGDSPVINDLINYYRGIDRANENNEPDIVIKSIQNKPKTDWYIKGALRRYERKKDGLVISNSKEDFIIINNNWDEFICKHDSSYGFVRYYIEYAIRKRLINQDLALIHCSGIKINNKTYLFHGTRSTGKTSTMLSLLQSGGSYLGDDRVWIKPDGIVHGYDLATKMGQANFNSFPELVDNSNLETLQLDFSTYLYNNFDRSGGFIEKVIYFINKFYIDPKTEERLESLEDLLPLAEYKNRAVVDELILLRSVPELDPNEISKQKIPKNKCAEEIISVTGFEWNDYLEEASKAQDMLFDTDSVNEFNTFISKENEIFENFVRSVESYTLTVPRTRRWYKTNIKSKLRDEFF